MWCGRGVEVGDGHGVEWGGDGGVVVEGTGPEQRSVTAQPSLPSRTMVKVGEQGSLNLYHRCLLLI